MLKSQLRCYNCKHKCPMNSLRRGRNETEEEKSLGEVRAKDCVLMPCSFHSGPHSGAR